MSERPDTGLKKQLLRQRYGEPKESWDKFREYILAEQSVGYPRANWEARALFEMIQLAFDGSGAGKITLADPYLIHNLAACTCVALRCPNDEQIPWDQHDDILRRTYTGFVHTLIAAVKQSKVRKIEGQIYFGGLRLPNWFVTWARDVAVGKSS